MSSGRPLIAVNWLDRAAFMTVWSVDLLTHSLPDISHLF